MEQEKLVYDGPGLIQQLIKLSYYLEIAGASPELLEIQVKTLRAWMNIRREADRGHLLDWQRQEDIQSPFRVCGFKFTFAGSY